MKSTEDLSEGGSLFQYRTLKVSLEKAAIIPVRDSDILGHMALTPDM